MVTCGHERPLCPWDVVAQPCASVRPQQEVGRGWVSRAPAANKRRCVVSLAGQCPPQGRHPPAQATTPGGDRAVARQQVCPFVLQTHPHACRVPGQPVKWPHKYGSECACERVRISVCVSVVCTCVLFHTCRCGVHAFVGVYVCACACTWAFA